MAFDVKKGTLVDFSTKKTGYNKDGRVWMMVKAVAPEGEKGSTTVFVTNADEAVMWTGKGRVEEIVSYRCGSRRKDDGTWENTYSVNVRVSGSNTVAEARQSNFEKFQKQMNNGRGDGLNMAGIDSGFLMAGEGDGEGLPFV